MIQLQAGQFIKSHSSKDYFCEAVVFLSEYNRSGAVGFVVNRPFPRGLHELTEFAYLPPFPLWEGGPVGTEHLYFIHCRPDLMADSILVSPGVYWSGNFSQAVQAIANSSLAEHQIRIFVGYCGWDAGDLEKEWQENEWSVTGFDLFPR